MEYKFMMKIYKYKDFLLFFQKVRQKSLLKVKAKNVLPSFNSPWTKS